MAKEKKETVEEDIEQEEKRKKNKKERLASAKKKYKKKLRKKILKIAALIVALFLINIYIILGIFYKDGGFTISLDYEEGKDPNLIIYESPEDKTQKTFLRCEDLDYFLSDLSLDWIPANVHNEADGSHHGLYYIAYTFYCENTGEYPVNYWSTAEIDYQAKGVDEAVRFIVYRNDEPRKIYAKRATNGNPEPGTIPFISDEKIFLEPRKDFMPGEIDKYTIVVMLDGNDPQCINDIIGGQIEMHMRITEEHITDEEQLKLLENKMNEENIIVQ